MTIGERTRRTVDALYAAYLEGDAEGMLHHLAPNVEVRFLGRGTYQGIEEVRQFLTTNVSKFENLDFRIRQIVVDGAVAAAIWDESATTRDGRPYENHGVDVFEVGADGILVLHENNDILEHRAAFDRR
jgi:ketosteroid isomerase-like protein